MMNGRSCETIHTPAGNGLKCADSLKSLVVEQQVVTYGGVVGCGVVGSCGGVVGCGGGDGVVVRRVVWRWVLLGAPARQAVWIQAQLVALKLQVVGWWVLLGVLKVGGWQEGWPGVSWEVTLPRWVLLVAWRVAKGLVVGRQLEEAMGYRLAGYPPKPSSRALPQCQGAALCR